MNECITVYSGQDLSVKEEASNSEAQNAWPDLRSTHMKLPRMHSVLFITSRTFSEALLTLITDLWQLHPC